MSAELVEDLEQQVDELIRLLTEENWRRQRAAVEDRVLVQVVSQSRSTALKVD